jgi:hypothetical protein
MTVDRPYRLLWVGVPPKVQLFVTLLPTVDVAWGDTSTYQYRDVTAAGVKATVLAVGLLGHVASLSL